jgi:hypothetical protein
VVYRRDPWGSRASQGLPSWSVSGHTATSSDGYVLAAAEGGDVVSHSGLVLDGGSWGPLSVPPLGTSALVALADVAGNTSAWVRVRDLEVVVTVGVPEGGTGAPGGLYLKRALTPPGAAGDVRTFGPGPIASQRVTVDGAAYARLAPAQPALATLLHRSGQLTWHPGLERVVGCDAAQNQPSPEVLLFRGGDWSDIVPLVPLTPGVNWSALLALSTFYDPDTERVYCKPGTYNPTFEAAPATPWKWTSVAAAGTPALGFRPAFVWSPVSRRTLAVSDTGTWAFADGGWSRAEATDGGSVWASASDGYGLAWDPSRAAIMLTGGVSGFPSRPQSRTWLYDETSDGGQWSVLDGGDFPLPVSEGGLVFDPLLGQMVAISNTLPSDPALYRFENGWQRLALVTDQAAPLPTPVWDPVDHQLVFAHGILETATSRPAAGLRLDLSALPTAEVPVRALSAVAVGEGHGQSPLDAGSLSVPGLVWLAWLDGGWVPLLSVSDGGQTMASVEGAALESLFVSQRADLAVTSVGTNGRGTAQLSVDYVEATVRYRLDAP